VRNSIDPRDKYTGSLQYLQFGGYLWTQPAGETAINTKPPAYFASIFAMLLLFGIKKMRFNMINDDFDF